MNYQSIGSGGGIAQIKAKTVDFGASDMPLKPEDLQTRGLDAVSGDHRWRRADRESRRRRARRAQAAPARCSPTSISARSRAGTTRRSPISTRASSFQRTRSPWYAARMVPARRSCGPTTCRRSSAGMEGQGRLQHRGRVARRRRRQGQRRGCRIRAAHQGCDRLRRVRVREEEQDGLRIAAESRRPVRRSPTTRRSRPRRPARTGRARPASARSSPNQPGQGELADHRRELHPDAREAGQAAERGARF